MSTCIQCGLPTNLPTVTEMASNWGLFCQYVNPDGEWPYSEWDALPTVALEDLIREVWPECEDRCLCTQVPSEELATPEENQEREIYRVATAILTAVPYDEMDDADLATLWEGRAKQLAQLVLGQEPDRNLI